MVRIIKAQAVKVPPPAQAGSPAPFVDLSDELHARLEAARVESAQLVADAREAAERVRREAQQQGQVLARDAALRQCREELDRRLATALPALGQAVACLEREKAQHLRHCERHVVRLAIAIAERLVRRELDRAPEITLSLVREALDLAASSERISLHLNPDDCETLRDSLAQLTTQRSSTQRLEIVSDPAIAAGACVVKTEFGTIDQQFQSQLARIEEELT
jgi:flagellar assembly protein FliH